MMATSKVTLAWLAREIALRMEGRLKGTRVVDQVREPSQLNVMFTAPARMFRKPPALNDGPPATERTLLRVRERYINPGADCLAQAVLDSGRFKFQPLLPPVVGAETVVIRNERLALRITQRQRFGHRRSPIRVDVLVGN